MKVTVKFSFVILIFLGVQVCSLQPAAGQVSISEFLRSAQDDSELKSFDDQLKYLQTKPYRLSPLQKLEFRTRNNELDPARQDYAIRINPANPWEMKSNTNYFKGVQSLLTLEKDLAWKDALHERYLLTIELLYFNGLKVLVEEDRSLTATQVAILEKQQYSSFFDGEDYLKLKLRQMDQTVDLEEVSFEVANQLSKISAKYPQAANQAINWNYDQVISIDRIENVVDSLLQQDEATATLQYREQKINLANQEYKLEKSNINLGFLQTQYQPYRVEQGRGPWNISLGVTIPITNPNKGDMAKRQLDVIEAEHELEETKGELQSGKIILKNQLKSQVERYRDLEGKIRELQSGSLAKTLATIKESNPAAIIQFNSNMVKLKSLSLKLREEIMNTYIEFLYSTDRLQQTPLSNYLSVTLEKIQ